MTIAWKNVFARRWGLIVLLVVFRTLASKSGSVSSENGQETISVFQSIEGRSSRYPRGLDFTNK